MKTKLTLTVHREIIEKARRHSKATGKSISQLLEEVFSDEMEQTFLKTDAQKAATKLLSLLDKAENRHDLENDKKLIKEHVKQKYS